MPVKCMVTVFLFGPFILSTNAMRKEASASRHRAKPRRGSSEERGHGMWERASGSDICMPRKEADSIMEVERNIEPTWQGLTMLKTSVLD